jgi:hypothetical protein
LSELNFQGMAWSRRITWHVPVKRCNLRNLPDPMAEPRMPPPITPGALLALLNEVQIIRVIWPNGNSKLIKGEPGSRQAVSAGARRVEFQITNTTQAELLTAALRPPRPREAIDARRLLLMLSIAASIPDDGEDDQRFAEKLRAWELGRRHQGV